ncbi:hypothetical protein [Shewanella sp. Isolate13]|nr:hypothetical protein [Shewanella sp. Isolate13]
MHRYAATELDCDLERIIGHDNLASILWNGEKCQCSYQQRG